MRAPVDVGQREPETWRQGFLDDDRQRRSCPAGSRRRTIEAPRDLAAALRAEARPGEVVLIDCLTLWGSNLLLREFGAGEDADLANAAALPAFEARVLIATEEVLDAARRSGIDLILVSNEVGMGLVPPFPLGSVFRDLLGRVNQAVAARAETVVLMVAGLPFELRSGPSRS